MNSVDDLIREIQDHEVVEIDGRLDNDSLRKIEERILRTVNEEKKDIRKKRSRKSWLVLGLAAIFAFALGLSVYAAKENEWDIALINFMGISDANTLQLENGVVEIDQGQRSLCVDYGYVPTGEEKEVEIQAVSSIGDKNEVYIRIETDYVLPDDFNAETDYVLPEDYGLSVSPNKSGFGSVFTYFAEDNKLGFLLAISNCQDINKAEISLSLENLYLYHDLQSDTAAEKELLCEGTWNLNWSYHYKSSTKSYHMLQPFQSEGVTYYLTKVEVSPISIRLEAFRMPWDRDKGNPDIGPEEIHFSDGTILSIYGLSEVGVQNRMFVESYVGAEVFGEAIDPEKVESVIIEGKEIVLH